MAEVSVQLAAISLLALFTVSLVGGLLPQVLKNRLADSRAFLRLADVFAAGILAAAAFVHLLPDATESLEALENDFPLAGALALGGATGMYLLDLFAAPSNSGYVLATALSLHALVEGLALGAAAKRENTFNTILLAILLHKAFGAFALSSALVGSGVQSHECAACALAFASATPAAALAALVFVREALEDRSGNLVSATLTAVSAGIFAYIAFGELLPNRHSHAPSTPSDEQHLPLTKTYGATGAAVKRSIRYACQFCRGELMCACNSALNYAKHADTHVVSEKLSAAVFLISATGMTVLAKWT